MNNQFYTSSAQTPINSILWRISFSFFLFFFLSINLPGQISLVEDVDSTGSGYIWSIVKFKDALYMDATDGVHGYELFKYDGDSVSLVEDFAPGSSNGNPDFLGVIDSFLYIQAGSKVFQYNGDTMVTFVNGYCSGIAKYNSDIFLVLDRKLYRYDNGSLIQIASFSNIGTAPTLYSFGGYLYISHYTSSAGYELARYDSSTIEYFDIAPGSTSSIYGSMFHPLAQGVIEFDSALYFRLNDGVNGAELGCIKNDSIYLAYDMVAGSGSSSPQFFGKYKGQIYFSASDATGDAELWTFNGDSAWRAAEINPNGNSQPLDFKEYNGLLYFSPYDHRGRELWRWDGVTASIVEDYYTGSSSSISGPRFLNTLNDTLFFAYNTLGLFRYNDPCLNLTISPTITTIDETCPISTDGEIRIDTVTSGTLPYEYSIDGGLTYQNSSYFTGLDSGSYFVRIRDMNGCLSLIDTQLVDVANPTGIWYFQDADGDGYGNPSAPQFGCAILGYVIDSTDCDDNDANAFPGQTWYLDMDGDGYAVSTIVQCFRPTGGYASCELGCAANEQAISGKMVPHNRSSSDYFGRDVDMYKDWLIVGAPGKGNSGSAYIYKRIDSTYKFIQEITTSSSAYNYQLGYNVAISDDYAVLGAQFADVVGSDAGAAYVFKRQGNQWIEQTTLTASNAGSQDYFGSSVAVSGNRIVVGAEGEDTKGNYSGAAYVYEFDGAAWVEDTMLTADTIGSYYWFGISVAIDEDRIVVGARGEDYNNTNLVGRVYVFKHDGTSWGQEAKLLSSMGSSTTSFGSEVDIDSSMIIVGINGHTVSQAQDGAAYIFEYDGANWNETAQLQRDTPTAGDYFGFSVSIDNGRAAVGCLNCRNNGVNGAGAGFLFEKTNNNWQEVGSIWDENPTNYDQIGVQIATNGFHAICGAPSEDYDENEQNSMSGAGAIFIAPFACSPTSLSCQLIPDCDDSDSTAYPNAEWYVDADGDGYGSTDSIIYACLQPTGFSADSTDCNDDNSNENPAAVWYIDADGDGFGVPDSTMISCTQPSGFAANSTDCNDMDANEYPGAMWFFDLDGDGFGSIDSTSCTRPVGALALCELTCAAVDTDTLEKIVSDDRQDYAYFGEAVDVSGDYAVVGAYAEEVNGVSTGVAYVYKKEANGWVQQQLLLPTDLNNGDQYGYAVAISGEYISVGARFHDAAGSNYGAVYIFKRTGTTWAQEAKLTTTSTQLFGETMALDGNYLAIGAPSEYGISTRSGVVYVYERSGSTWSQAARLTQPEYGGYNKYFGRAIDISGDRLIVGQPTDDRSTSNDGAAYVFDRTGGTWAPEATLLASNPAYNEALGIDVSISGNRILLGSRRNGTYTYEGAAHYYEYSGGQWQEKAIITNDSASSNYEYFGNKLDMDGNTAIISAYGKKHSSGHNRGAAYVYEFTGGAWNMVKEHLGPINLPPATYSDIETAFGQYSVALDGNIALVGARQDATDKEGNNFLYFAGAAHFFYTGCSPDFAACTGTDDCDDTDSNVYPGKLWYEDLDGDNYGGADSISCFRPVGLFAEEELLGIGDCNDLDTLFHPGRPELCDGIDNNCSGVIDDGEAPTLSCPDTIPVYLDEYCYGYMYDLNDYVNITDDCDTAFLKEQDISIGSYLYYDQIATYSATDSAGLLSTCAIYLQMTDTLPPTVTCPDSISAIALAGQCNTQVSWPSIEYYTSDYYDNCNVTNISASVPGGLVSSLYPNDIGLVPVGENTITYTVSDAGGNTGTCSFAVTVLDTVPPVLVGCPTADIIVDASPIACTAPVGWGSIYPTDNCSVTMTNTYDPGTFFPIGSTEVLYIAEDISANTDTCRFNVIVNDVVPPTALCQDLTVHLDATGNVALTAAMIDNGSWDSCGIMSYALDTAGFGCMSAGLSETVTLTVSDFGLNLGTCTATVMVLDTTAPVNLSCPTGTSGTTTSTSCYGAMGWVLPEWSDNCGTPTVSFTAPGVSLSTVGTSVFGTFPAGTTTVEYTAMDVSNNVTICSFDVVIDDVIAPYFVGCPADTVISTDAGQCDAQFIWIEPIAHDNCTGFSVNQSHSLNQTFSQGTTTISYQVTDINDNTADCSFNVTVNDTEAPIFSCPSDMTLTAPSGSCSVTANFSAPTATDNCSVTVAHVEGPQPGHLISVGTSTSVWTASDTSGNSVQCSFNITVLTTDIWYADTDGDGYGDASSTTIACLPPMGYVADNTDCNDADSTTYPGAPDICDGIDNDCNGVIDNLTGCDRVTDVVVAAGSDTALITWPPVCAALSYDVAYRPETNVTYPWVWSRNQTDTFVLMTNLAYGVEYRVRIRTKCGPGSVSTFRNLYIETDTVPACVTPVFTDLTATDTSITAQWSNVDGEDIVRFFWREIGSSWNFINFKNDETTHTVTGLNPDTRHQFRLRTLCGGTWLDLTKNVSYYTLPPAPMPRNSTESLFSLNAYPNPFEDEFTVETDMLGAKQIHIFSATGRLMTSWEENRQKFRVDLSKLANGIYFLQVTSANGTIVRQKLIKTAH